jgi:hypothetical protein
MIIEVFFATARDVTGYMILVTGYMNLKDQK